MTFCNTKKLCVPLRKAEFFVYEGGQFEQSRMVSPDRA